jgi:hypothetical protein
MCESHHKKRSSKYSVKKHCHDSDSDSDFDSYRHSRHSKYSKYSKYTSKHRKYTSKHNKDKRHLSKYNDNTINVNVNTNINNKVDKSTLTEKSNNVSSPYKRRHTVDKTHRRCPKCHYNLDNISEQSDRSDRSHRSERSDRSDKHSKWTSDEFGEE